MPLSLDNPLIGRLVSTNWPVTLNHRQTNPKSRFPLAKLQLVSIFAGHNLTKNVRPLSRASIRTAAGVVCRLISNTAAGGAAGAGGGGGGGGASSCSASSSIVGYIIKALTLHYLLQ
uniref:Uncharacterized protein n=1 Tax=Glossina austeni TaxID=7395 RepID=A0A1A9VH58_GLOAU